MELGEVSILVKLSESESKLLNDYFVSQELL